MNVWLLIIGMALVTYIPRVIPAFVVEKLHFGKRFGKFINLIPYTAMTALIVPGVFSVEAGAWYVGAIGAGVAIALACIKKMPTALTVFLSVLAVAAVYAFI